MIDKPDNVWDDFFTLEKKARYWSDLYDLPKTVFEFNMIRRRDWAVTYLANRFPEASKIEVLDLGCGAGVLLEKIIPLGYNCTGADRSEDMLQIAETRLKQLGVTETPNLRLADALSLPFETDSFDVVAAMGMFGYIDDVDRALSEIQRVLRPGGVFIMSIRNHYTHKIFDPGLLIRIPYWSARSITKRIIYGKENFHIKIFDRPKKVIKGIERNGFILDKYDGFGYGPITLNEKQFLSDSKNIRVSEWLDNKFRQTGLHKYTRWITDVNMSTFTTPKKPIIK